MQGPKACASLDSPTAFYNGYCSKSAHVTANRNLQGLPHELPDSTTEVRPLFRLHNEGEHA